MAFGKPFEKGKKPPFGAKGKGKAPPFAAKGKPAEEEEEEGKKPAAGKKLPPNFRNWAGRAKKKA